MFICFDWKIPGHFDKINKEVKTERVSSWTEAQYSCLGFTSFSIPPSLLPKTTDKLLVWNLYLFMYVIQTSDVKGSDVKVVYFVFRRKWRLLTEAVCRPLFTKCAIVNDYFHFKICIINSARISRQDLGYVCCVEPSIK